MRWSESLPRMPKPWSGLRNRLSRRTPQARGPGTSGESGRAALDGGKKRLSVIGDVVTIYPPGGTTVRRHNRLGLAGFAAVTAAVLAAAGCSSSSSSSPTAPASTSAAPASSLPASTGTGGQGAQSVTNYLNYTGGKSGAADTSLPPVYIGYVNQQGGPTAVGLLATAGAEMAVK